MSFDIGAFPDFDLVLREFVQIRKRNLAQGLRIATERNQPALIEEQKRLLSELDPWPVDDNARFMIAEGALLLIALERFLRMILSRTGEENRNVMLSKLLDEATGGAQPLLSVPPSQPMDKVKADIVLIRNTLLHGNFEQLAKNEGLSVEAYFGTKYTPALESLFRTLDSFLDQIDRDTGERKNP